MQLATKKIIAREVFFLLGVGVVFIACSLVDHYLPFATNPYELESDRFFVAFQRQELANRIHQAATPEEKAKARKEAEKYETIAKNIEKAKNRNEWRTLIHTIFDPDRSPIIIASVLFPIRYLLFIFLWVLKTLRTK